ncbi:DUF4270 domain-containing protein [Nonlabens marinus]|uniref:DUF4270 domain-containing protein n=1 Tax=Nonlabens marinus S1-08 TaxID=1454201 RepID=W8VPY4_9FLAO|nr:DUF4270 domain-containing protein [Nonlabens marinus]BAO54725.1 hypothetical protein NMS_0716 [Nonlabens marinus S1-08]
MNKLLKYGTMVLAIVFVLVSCDTDPTELGSDFLGIDIDGTIVQQDFEAKAFSAPLNPVQTNNFPSVQLGTYTDPLYGETKYEFVTQLSLATAGVDFGANRRLDSVVLEIPYFTTVEGREGEATTYSIDSLYGTGEVDVKIFENRYFLNSFDPNNVDQAAVYYSDFGSVIAANAGQEILPFNENNGVNPLLVSFRPDNREINLTEVDDTNTKVTTERLSPRLRQKLDLEYWEQKIFNLPTGASQLSSDSNFQNYLRGLYFKVSNPTNDGMLAYLNLNDAAITLYYNSDILDLNDSNGNGRTDDFFNIDSSFKINLAGTKVVLTESNVPQQTQAAISNSFNPIEGSERLYINGGAGAITLIDLFGPDNDNDGEADALTLLKSKNVLVNEANLEFYVDKAQVTAGSKEPERILIYDFVTGRYLLDFEPSGTGITSNINHLGRLEVESNGDRRYKIRLTNHISQVLQDNLPNNRLAVVVSQNVSLLGSSKVKSQTQPLPISSIPISAGIAHEGTVLHGNLSDDAAKRLKLKVFYTEPN